MDQALLGRIMCFSELSMVVAALSKCTANIQQQMLYISCNMMRK